MTATTALLIGGPRDGDLLTVQSDRDSIAVAERDDRETFAAYDYLRNRPRSGAYRESEVYSGPAFRTRYYHREDVHLFGRRLPVWVFEGVRPHERDEAISRHLLSPVALGLLGGQK